MASSHRSTLEISSTLSVVVVCAVLLAGCRTQPMLDPGPIFSPLGVEQNRQAILRGLIAHRWVMVADEPGRVTARQDKSGRHVATVDIDYDGEQIDIGYNSSHGLRCERSADGSSCESIHRAYNRWVVQLRKDIEYGIQVVRLESMGGQPVGAQ